jgi:hypothetical protein
MKKTFKQLKDISTAAAAALDIDYSDAARLVASFSAVGDWATVDKISGGDYSALYTAAADLGVAVPRGASVKNKGIPGDGFKNTTIKAAAEQGSAVPAASVAGSVLADNFEGVPAALLDLVYSCIESACTTYKIDDLSKASAERWRAVCMYTGRHIKESKMLFDIDRLKSHGGKIIYNPDRVAALLPVWVELCGAFDKAPMACDFISFAGVSSSWLYDAGGHDLTSSRVDLGQKLRDIQEAGLAVRLADGRRNPTGQIFILKNLHGWRDQREIIHNDAGNGSTAAALPVFNSPGLPEKP